MRRCRSKAAAPRTADFPLGLPLSARQESVIPLDLSISFADLPGLAGALRKLAVGGRVAYELNGTVGVDAGRLGTPTFGPMLLTRGEMRVVDSPLSLVFGAWSVHGSWSLVRP